MNRIKCEIFSDNEDDVRSDDKHNNSDDDGDGDDDEDGSDSSSHDGSRIELLEFERNIMLDTFTDDVLFVLARGLGLENLILHHLFLYSDQKLLIFVINTTQYDEAFFLSKLQSAKCPPKMITSDIGIKEREALYLEGGVQFITSRILMVDLLQDRVPVKNVAGIIVHRAHQLLVSFQESFILRLYREKKADGFVKAFTDNPGILNSIGALQRLVNRLYVRRVRLLPRFDVDVKRILDLYPPTLIELYSDLPLPMRRIQSALVDIIRTCLKELKQSLNFEVINEEEVINSPTGLVPTLLEMQLNAKQLLLTEKQQRLLFDLKQLRRLLFEAEELDPTTLFRTLTTVRSDKDQLSRNSGWLFTQTASKLFAEAENICKLKKKDEFVILAPSKWSSLKKVLQEIRESIKCRFQKKISVAPVLLIASNSDVCVQLKDLINYGPSLLKWIKFREVMALLSINKSSNEPEKEPLWDPTQIVLFASNLDGGKRSDVFSSVKTAQKMVAQKGRKRRKAAENELKRKKFSKDSCNQTNLIQFGIVHYKKSTKDHEDLDKDRKSNVGDTAGTEIVDELAEDKYTEQEPLLLLLPQGERYNLLRQLENFKPNDVILYHSDLVTLRLLEMYKACHPEHDLRIYVLMYRESNEEERYLCSLRQEQLAFEHLIREQGTLMTPKEYDTSREPPPKLQLAKSTRSCGGRTEVQEVPKVIIDMREFNSELPTVLYKRGIDIVPATLEVGDYILTPDIALERKAHDDLSQSLYSGRVFKQVEQMLRTYKRAILLIEANEKASNKKINGGPFQGELSRRCRETRYLFTVLIRSYPAMNIIWSLDPVYSSELFEELKLNQPNPDFEQAISIKSDADIVNENPDSDQKRGEPEISRESPEDLHINAVLQRQLSRLPNTSVGDITKMMKSKIAKCLLDVINADNAMMTCIFDYNPVLGQDLQRFFSTNFQTKTHTP